MAPGPIYMKYHTKMPPTHSAMQIKNEKAHPQDHCTPMLLSSDIDTISPQAAPVITEVLLNFWLRSGKKFPAWPKTNKQTNNQQGSEKHWQT